MNTTVGGIHSDLESTFLHATNFNRNAIKEFHVFPQTFGSTALCFGGMGGNTITTVNVVVIWTTSGGAVYCAGREVYSNLTRNEYLDIVKNRRFEWD